jgi:hypothetical protein
MTQLIPISTYVRALPVFGLLLLGCGQPAPPGSEAGGDTTDASGTDTTAGTESGTDAGTDTGDVEDESLYPLVDGARWTYRITTTNGQVIGMNTVDVNETTWNGAPAWEQVDSPNANGSWDVSTLIWDGPLALRVHREEIDQTGTTALIDYDPGFVRASEAWDAVGIKEEYLYDRTAYDGNGQNPVLEARGHTFEILAIDEQVIVPAGTFSCVKVERVRTIGTEAGALARFWYAPGVGKIREERPIEMEIEELISVSIPGGVSLP